ncbi:MAG: peptidylprolyl isomerase [Candidatus Taylorbacteria bacterium]|nr:peptidylprolyl isomerase [Candidatus Taylorbacteria bacterium]
MSTTSQWVTGIIVLVVIGVLWYFLDHRNLNLVPTNVNVPVTTPTTGTTTPEVQTQSPTPSPTASTNKPLKNNMHTVTLETNKGKIVFETYDADAPNTVKNFVTLTDKGFYNGLIFHRVIKDFMIQGGDPTGTGTGGPGYKFADELDPTTASYKAGYVRGVVAMANSGPDTNGSQFFIMHKDTPLPNNYTIFGKVISGMNVVDAIAATTVDANDKPITPVTMTKVTEKAK